MTYNELLQQKEWWVKCNEILSRDHYTCKDCGCLGYHNGDCYASLNETSAIDSIFSSLTLDGYSISQFCSNLKDYDLEHFEDVVLRSKESSNQASRYSFKLYDKESKYFHYLPRGFSYDFISDVACDKISMDAIILNNVISYNSQKPEHTWLFAFKFEKDLADKVYLSINSNNGSVPSTDTISVGSYVIYINFRDTLILLSIESSKEVIFKGLNVHHTYYIKGHKPWEYENDALVTLCEDCHKKRHKGTAVPLLNDNKELIANLATCPRCGGSGYLPQYKHVEHGICFKCGGEGVILNDW